jgi:hypothetical protein
MLALPATTLKNCKTCGDIKSIVTTEEEIRQKKHRLIAINTAPIWRATRSLILTGIYSRQFSVTSPIQLATVG